MQIRCRNCHSEIDVPVQPGQAPDAINCPSCDFTNYLRGAATGAATGRCTSCGREMALQPGQTVPLCSSCAGGDAAGPPGDDESQVWMIRKVGGKAYGPFTAAVVRQWITDTRISPADEIARAGGSWDPAFEGPFADAFTEEARAVAQKAWRAARRQQEAEEKRRERDKRKIPWGRVVRVGAATAAAAASIGLAWQSSRAMWFVVPEVMVDQAAAVVQEQVVERVEAPRASPDVVKAEADKVLAEIAARVGPVEEASPRLRLMGRAQFLADTTAGDTAARTSLEKAVTKNPQNALALGALVEVYARAIRQDQATSLTQAALRLSDRAYQLAPSSADVLRAKAAFLIATGSDKSARELAKQALDQNPADAEAAYLIGLSHTVSRPGDPEAAVLALTRAIEINPRHQASHRLLGRVYEGLQHYAQSVAHYRKKLELSPAHLPTLYALGNVFQRVGNADEALASYRKALQVSKDNHLPSLIAAGVILAQHRGELANAKRLLEGAVQHEGFGALPAADQIGALVQLSTVHRLLGEGRLAASRAEEALSRDNNSASALYAAGMAAFSQGDRDGGIRLLKRASTLEVRPEVLAEVRLALGMLSVLDQKAREAITEFRGATEVDKHSFKAQLNLAGAYLDAGQVDEALLVLSRLSRLDPLYGRRKQFRPREVWEDEFGIDRAVAGLARVAKEKYYVADPLAALGVVLYHAGRPDQAAEQLTRALKVDPNNAPAHFYLGILQLEAGQFAEAAASLERATQADPQAGIFHAYLGEALTRLGRYADAEESFKRAQQYEPKSPSVKVGMGFLRVKQGEMGLARQAFLDALDSDADFVTARWQIYQFNL